MSRKKLFIEHKCLTLYKSKGEREVNNNIKIAALIICNSINKFDMINNYSKLIVFQIAIVGCDFRFLSSSLQWNILFFAHSFPLDLLQISFFFLFCLWLLFSD